MKTSNGVLLRQVIRLLSELSTDDLQGLLRALQRHAERLQRQPQERSDLQYVPPDSPSAKAESAIRPSHPDSPA